MELFIATGLPIVLLFGITLLFMSDVMPSWVQQYKSNNLIFWDFVIISISTVTIIIYLAKR